MKKATFFILLTFGLSLLNAQVYENTSVITVPDGTTGCGSNSTPGQAVSIVNVPITGTIANPDLVTIGFAMAATWSGELVIELIPPGQTNGCALVRRVGAATATACGMSGDFVSTNVMSFSSANVTPIPNVSTPVPAGNYIPTGGADPFPMALCDLSTMLNGLSIQGDWTLRVFDHGGGDFNFIHLFRITFAENSLSVDSPNFNDSKLTVLSNPFTDTLELRSSLNTSEIAIEVYSIDGKQIYKDTALVDQNSLISINTQSWNSGLYFVVPIIDGSPKTPLKVIKK